MKTSTGFAAKAVFALLPLLQGVAAVNLAGTTVNAFPNTTGNGCSLGTYYASFDIGTGYPDCSVNYFSDPNFPVDSQGSTPMYWALPDPGEECKVFVRAPSDVTNPGCGDPILVQSGGHGQSCNLVEVPMPFDLNFCCGTEDCNSALGSTGKRDLSHLIDDPHQPGLKRMPTSLEKSTIDAQLKAEKREPKLRDVTSVKRTYPLAIRQSDCTFNQPGQYTQDGGIQTITGTVSCDNTQTCSTTYQATVEVSTSQTFGVSETTEVDLFDIVSESFTLSYDYTYETSHSTSISVTYNIPPGGSGYVTWTPTLVCGQGSFSGSNCGSIPTNTQGQACIPSMLSDSKTPYGTTNFVQVA